MGAVDSDDLDVYLTPQRHKKNVRSLFGSVERGLNTVKQILTPKRTSANKPRKTWVGHAFRSRRSSPECWKSVLAIRASNTIDLFFVQETANVTPIGMDDVDKVCDLLEQAIKVNSQLKYKEKGYAHLSM